MVVSSSEFSRDKFINLESCVGFPQRPVGLGGRKVQLGAFQLVVEPFDFDQSRGSTFDLEREVAFGRVQFGGHPLGIRLGSVELSLTIDELLSDKDHLSLQIDRLLFGLHELPFTLGQLLAGLHQLQLTLDPLISRFPEQSLAKDDLGLLLILQVDQNQMATFAKIELVVERCKRRLLHHSCRFQQPIIVLPWPHNVPRQLESEIRIDLLGVLTRQVERVVGCPCDDCVVVAELEQEQDLYQTVSVPHRIVLYEVQPQSTKTRAWSEYFILGKDIVQAYSRPFDIIFLSWMMLMLCGQQGTSDPATSVL